MNKEKFFLFMKFNILFNIITEIFKSANHMVF